MNSESEVVEFKEAKNDYSFDKIGQYFSALTNEANLNRKESAWLVFGVEDSKHRVVGTQYRSSNNKLEKLKRELAQHTTSNISFREIHEVIHNERRVVIFEIPPAPRGIPVAWKGHYYGRNFSSIVPLNLEKIERIRSQATLEDWSALTIPHANIDDLDAAAIQQARKNFAQKFPNKAIEIEALDDITFLNKVTVTIRGNITNTALILLGKPESEQLLSPSVSKIRWLLKDEHGNTLDYQIESCPFILSVERIFKRMQNIKYRYMKEGTLFPNEVDKYDPFTIREAMHNSIAHQDYSKAGIINIIEKPDELKFTNSGSFIPQSVEQVVTDDSPPDFYRNRFLSNAMFLLNMVDTAGGGIRKMYLSQKERFFPLPEYELSPERVEVTIIGKVLDIAFARILARDKTLSLEDIIILDKVQKKKGISIEEAEFVKNRKLIEGRRPNYYISQRISQSIGKKADYSLNRAFNKKYYLDLIIEAISTHSLMSRKEIDTLLWEKLPNWMTNKQKKYKITNLIAELRKKKKIINRGTRTASEWTVV